MSFEEVIKGIGNDVLTEESRQSIIEAFNNAVEENVNLKIDERVKIELETALSQVDEQHGKMLEELLEAVDADHTEKIKKVLVKVDTDYAGKLQTVINKYENMLQTEAVAFRDQLVGEISNYIELYIDKLVPVDQIAEACENTQAKNILNNIKKLVSVDEEFVNENIKEALEDGKSMIDTLHKELSEAVKDNVRVNQELKSAKATIILEEKTQSMPADKKSYVMRVLKGKSPEEIEGNLEYVVEMFERDQSADAKVITEQARVKISSKNVDTPASRLEDINDVKRSETPVNGYLEELKR